MLWKKSNHLTRQCQLFIILNIKMDKSWVKCFKILHRATWNKAQQKKIFKDCIDILPCCSSHPSYTESVWVYQCFMHMRIHTWHMQIYLDVEVGNIVHKYFSCKHKTINVYILHVHDMVNPVKQMHTQKTIDFPLTNIPTVYA